MSETATAPPSSPRSRLPWPVLVGVALAVIAAGGLLLTLRPPAAGPGAATGGHPGPAPAFRLATLDGRQLGPADFPGQVVLIDFWATWCVPCHMQAEVLAEVHAAQQGRAVQILAVSVGEEEETVREFAAKKPFGYPVLLDPATEVADAFEVFTLPTVVVLDRRGRIVLRESGLVDARTLERAIDAALAS